MDMISRIMIVVLCDIVVLVCGINLGIVLGNKERKAYLNDWADYALTDCQEDGVADCHIEPIYNGAVFVDYQIIGREN